MNKERVELFRDLLLVGKIQGTIKGNPNTLEVHGSNFDDMSCLFTLEDAISAPSSHASNIEKLGTIDHVVI